MHSIAEPSPEYEIKTKGFDPYKETVKAMLWEKSGGHCWYCGDELKNGWIIEHVHPRSKGGSYHIDNLVPACRSCNVIKSNKSLDEFKKLLQHKLVNAPKFTREQLEYLLNTLGVDPYVTEGGDLAPFWFEKEGKA